MKAKRPRAARAPSAMVKLTVMMPLELVQRLKAFSGSRNEPVRKTLIRSAEREIDGFYFATRTDGKTSSDSPILKIG